jgi:hypothetical protein
MAHERSFALITFAGLVFATTANAEPFEGPFRGVLVCAQLKTAASMLRAPLDLIVHGSRAVFARPIYRIDGSLVVGSELAFGTVESDGKLHLTATWENGGAGFTGDYSGALTPTGGTLVGTEIWHAADGLILTRACTAALVPVRDEKQAAAPK